MRPPSSPSTAFLLVQLGRTRNEVPCHRGRKHQKDSLPANNEGQHLGRQPSRAATTTSRNKNPRTRCSRDNTCDQERHGDAGRRRVPDKATIPSALTSLAENYACRPPPLPTAKDRTGTSQDDQQGLVSFGSFAQEWKGLGFGVYAKP